MPDIVGDDLANVPANGQLTIVSNHPGISCFRMWPLINEVKRLLDEPVRIVLGDPIP